MEESKPMKRLLFSLLAFLLFLPSLRAEPDFKAILKKIDQMGNFEDTDFSGIATIVSEKPGEENNITQARLFRRDKEEKFVILILQPEVQKGQGYLRVDDNVWFYDPDSRKFSHSSLKENIQGSDARNSDFNVSSYSEDYEVKGYKEDRLGSYDVYVLDLVARTNEVSYPKLKLWVRKDNYLVLKIENYSLSDRLMRTSLYPTYVSVGSRYLPSKMLFIDELKKGERTQVTLKDVSVASIPDSVFTKSYLERVNK
jgi:outer membrane lipoprotein-sorting protein